MKKILCLALSATLLMSLGGCGAPASSSAPSTPPAVSSVPVTPESAPGVSLGGVKPIVGTEKLSVADAAIYRGTVTATDGGTDSAMVLTLEQAEGTDFGAPSLKFRISDDTRISFPAEDLAGGMTGVYLEIFYGTAPDAKLDATVVHDAIAVNSYIVEGMVNLNGIVKELPTETKPGEGSILIEDLNNEGSLVMFHYGADTQFYLDKATLKVGDKLNFFHSPAMTMSLPPQCNAYEIRPYAAPAA